MSILVVGVNLRTAPLAVLERFAVAADEVPKAVDGLAQRDNVREAAVLSTCGRTEIYAVAERFHGAYADLTEYLAGVGGMSVDELDPYLFTQHDEAAATHLLEVAAGLDSAVIGESEILGQVRSAWKVALAHGGVKSTLDLLFRTAIRTGKRARTETTIGRGTASISHAAVEMLSERLGSLDGSRVLVVGAGDMGRGVATALHAAGASDIVVANRTAARGQRLAERVGGRLVSFEELPAELAACDVAVTCAAGDVTIDEDLVAHRSADAPPLLIVDIAVPRNVAVEAVEAERQTLTVLDLDDLRSWAERAINARAADAGKVGAIVADELERFLVDSTARQSAPLVAKLHDRAEQVRTDEVERYAGRLNGLDERQREAVEALTRAIVAKLLHVPTVRLRDGAGSPQGQRNAAAISDLFDLDT